MMYECFVCFWATRSSSLSSTDYSSSSTSLNHKAVNKMNNTSKRPLYSIHCVSFPALPPLQWHIVGSYKYTYVRIWIGKSNKALHFLTTRGSRPRWNAFIVNRLAHDTTRPPKSVATPPRAFAGFRRASDTWLPQGGRHKGQGPSHNQACKRQKQACAGVAYWRKLLTDRQNESEEEKDYGKGRRGQNAEEVTFTTHISFSLRCGNDKWTRFGSVFITHSVGIPTAANLVSMVLCVCSVPVPMFKWASDGRFYLFVYHT